MTIVIGENLIDLLVDAKGDVTAAPGGGPFNVARTIARLGQSVTLFSGLSNDAFGAVLRRVLERDQVSLAFKDSLEIPTALAVVDTTSTSPRYSFHLRDTAAFEIASREGVYALRSMPSATALYVGTLGLVVEPMAGMVEDVVAAAPSSTLVVLDPNWRPSATPDHDAYRSCVARLLPRSDVVKVSTEDLSFLFPETTPEESAAALLRGGATTVIITDGPNPVRAYSGSDEVRVDVPISRIEDTVGAGDALVGGLLAWWAARRLTREHAHNLPFMALMTHPWVAFAG
jgi:fructokinase